MVQRTPCGLQKGNQIFNYSILERLKQLNKNEQFSALGSHNSWRMRGLITGMFLEDYSTEHFFLSNIIY